MTSYKLLQRCCDVPDAGYQQMDNGSLRIDSVSMTHSGIYVCVAQNSAGTAMSQVRLRVQGNLIDFPHCSVAMFLWG